jgi:hypothetical protein
MTDFGLHGLRPPKANAPKWYPGLRADRRDDGGPTVGHRRLRTDGLKTVAKICEALLRGLSTVAYHLTSDA